MAVLEKIPEIDRTEVTLEWVSPLEAECFEEYRDQEFLTRLGLEDHASDLARFWPSRGPVWDALARVRLSDDGKAIGVLLVEAKRRPSEIYGNGCNATAEASIRQIEHALSEAKQWCGADCQSRWTDRLYQYGNRLAHVYFLRGVLGVRAWLVNIHFTEDPHSPTSRVVWDNALPEIKKELGFDEGAPHTVDIFLQARGPELFQPRAQNLRVLG